MEKNVIRMWRRKVWWRALMFAMPTLYFFTATVLNQLDPIPKGLPIALIVVGAWLGVHAHGYALERVYTYVDKEEVARVQYRRILQSFDGLDGSAWVLKAQEYGDPFFPRRIVLGVISGNIERVVLFDWIKGRFYAPRRLRNKRYRTLRECLEQG